MGQTPDRRPGKLREDDSIVLADIGEEPTEPGEIAYSAGVFRMRDAGGSFDPRSGGGFAIDSVVTSGSTGDVFVFRSTGNVVLFNG